MATWACRLTPVPLLFCLDDDDLLDIVFREAVTLARCWLESSPAEFAASLPMPTDDHVLGAARYSKQSPSPTSFPWTLRAHCLIGSPAVLRYCVSLHFQHDLETPVNSLLPSPSAPGDGDDGPGRADAAAIAINAAVGTPIPHQYLSNPPERVILSCVFRATAFGDFVAWLVARFSLGRVCRVLREARAMALPVLVAGGRSMLLGAPPTTSAVRWAPGVKQEKLVPVPPVLPPVAFDLTEMDAWRAVRSPSGVTTLSSTSSSSSSSSAPSQWPSGRPCR